MYYVYIVECKDGTLYTGLAIDLVYRIAQHNLGKGAKYTRSRIPVILKYHEQLNTIQDARRREYQIKQLNRAEKLRLINEKEPTR